MIDSTTRFSSRVDAYVKHRPRYPREILTALEEGCGLTPASVIADVGAGTGMSTELFLEYGNEVFAVEPNRAMREAGIALLAASPRFHSIDGRAEATTLRDASVDFVVAGQAFHWFNRDQARVEFSRILRPRGWVGLMWNVRDDRSTPFLAGYEQLLVRHGTDYAEVTHRQVTPGQLTAFYGPSGFTTKTFRTGQSLDYDGLEGRLLSSSYAPEPGHPNHEPMLHALKDLFQRSQTAERVVLQYDTTLYYGRLD